jgi:hypothetical protein
VSQLHPPNLEPNGLTLTSNPGKRKSRDMFNRQQHTIDVYDLGNMQFSFLVAFESASSATKTGVEDGCANRGWVIMKSIEHRPSRILCFTYTPVRNSDIGRQRFHHEGTPLMWTSWCPMPRSP